MPSPAELRRVGIERDDRNFFLVGGHEPHSQRQITTGLALQAAIGVIRQTVELTQQASHFSALDPELFKVRCGADFFVFPPHYLFIEVARRHHVRSATPQLDRRLQLPDNVPEPVVGSRVAVHHLGLALDNPHDSRVYLSTAMPDTRQTAPVVLDVSAEDLNDLHFASAAVRDPQQLGLVDPHLLLIPPQKLQKLAA